MKDQVACGVKTPWYHWHRFAVLPNIRIKKADEYNTWGFNFHWLIFRAWTSDAPMLGCSIGLDDHDLKIRVDLPYLWTGIFIPLFPANIHQRFWRKPKSSRW